MTPALRVAFSYGCRIGSCHMSLTRSLGSQGYRLSALGLGSGPTVNGVEMFVNKRGIAVQHRMPSLPGPTFLAVGFWSQNNFSYPAFAFRPDAVYLYQADYDWEHWDFYRAENLISAHFHNSIQYSASWFYLPQALVPSVVVVWEGGFLSQAAKFGVESFGWIWPERPDLAQ